MQTLINATISSLEQVAGIIDTVSDEHYQSLSIGEHIRHIYDHLLAFEKGYDSDQTINYNFRRRDHSLERARLEAQSELGEHQHWFATVALENKAINIISEFDCHETHSELFQSYVSRELLYLINHTVHHVAYLRLKLEQSGYTFSETIGLAPATITYQRNQAEEGTQAFA